MEDRMNVWRRCGVMERERRRWRRRRKKRRRKKKKKNQIVKGERESKLVYCLDQGIAPSPSIE